MKLQSHAVVFCLSFIAALPLGAQMKLPAQQTQPSQPQAQSSQAPKMDSIPEANSPEADKPAVPVAEIVVRINDQIISKADYDRARRELDEELKNDNAPPDEVERRRAQMLSDLIDQQLLLSRGKELGITGDDETIRRLDEIRKQYHLDSMEELEKAAKSQGVSFEDFKANIRNGVITSEVIRKEVAQNVHLTSAEEQAFYNAHKDEFAQPESVRLSEILIPVDGDSDAAVAAAKAKADEVYAKVKDGADFAAAAKASSTGPTAQQGGDLGVFKRGQLAGELEEKTFALNAGGVAEPIRTKQGFVILKVKDHTKAGVQPYDAVREQVMQEAYSARMQPMLRDYLTKLREQAFIDPKPGYVDVHASPNETHPVFSAYTPPPKKKDKVAAQKARYRSKTELPQRQPKIQKAGANTAVPGGPTAAADAAYKNAVAHPAAQPPPAPAPLPSELRADKKAAAKSAKKNSRPVKVRFGQGQEAAQLPPSPQEQADAGTTTTTAGQPSGDLSASAQAGQESSLSPESRKILGIDAAPKAAKTRFQQTPVVSHTQVKEHAEQVKASQQAAPPDATEVATSAVNSAPLGLNGNTANPQKAKPGEKTRMQAKPADEPPPTRANPGTPGATDYNAQADQKQQAATASAEAPKKRHKLLGII